MAHTLMGGARTADMGTNLDVQATLAAIPPRGVMGRMRQALAYVILGADAPGAWFPPMQPLPPIAQQPEQGAVGRAFDYPVGYNLRVSPRQEEAIGFASLKALADGYDLMRLVLETRKDEVAGAKWSFGPKDQSRRKDPDVQRRCEALTAFFEFPDRAHAFDDWLRMLLEQLFVYDAPTLYCEMTRGGELYALEVLDGATITRKLTLDGRTPRADEGPAYQQVLKGVPAVDYVTAVGRGMPVPLQDNGFPMPELIYKPRNPRVDRVYGFSPVEQVVTTVNIALRRQYHQLTYYTDGATPDLLMGVPPEWNADQIAKFQNWWDDLLSGNSANRRKGRFIPGGFTPFNVKESALKDEMDDWLARIICFAFSISPTPFIKQMNRATADNATEQATMQGVKPIQQWITGLINLVLALKFDSPDLTLRWDEEEALTATEQQQVYTGYIKGRVYHPDEVRQKLGDDPMPAELRAQMDLANYVDAPNATVLPDDQQAAQNEHAIALAAARPAPTVPPDPGAAKVDAIAALLKAAPGAPTINVDARTTISEGAIKQGDHFIDVGATTVKVDGERRAVANAQQE